MKIIPIAEESLGVRSMALYVETSDLGIILDPGISLAPRRFGLPPHPRELERARALRAVLEEYAKRAQYLFHSHMHRDHFTVPYKSIYMATEEDSYVKVYEGKVVLTKSPGDMNWSQRRRHQGLTRAIGNLVKALVYVDGKRFTIGSTELIASPPLPHGPEESRTGRVVSLTIIEQGDSLTFMADVQGPISKAAMDYAYSMRPRTLVVGGPPIYLVNHAFTWDQIETGIRNLRRLASSGFLETLVIAHHALRHIHWRTVLREVFEEASRRGVEVLTYAELLGRGEELLEARRRELYQEEPPPSEHLKLFLEDEED